MRAFLVSDNHDTLVLLRLAGIAGVIAHGAALLAAAINRALQPRLSIAQLGWLTN